MDKKPTSCFIIVLTSMKTCKATAPPATGAPTSCVPAFCITRNVHTTGNKGCRGKEEGALVFKNTHTQWKRWFH